MTDLPPTRRLAHSTSPYLRQHAGNPVDWYPWGEEAFAKARLEDKPILLSIGYSACHWCHVMAHESFEDEMTAQVMNALYVNIKVDREERPDLDRIYQTAHQLLARRPGGWPLTMFLAPDTHLPFFGGTYFPRIARYGMPAFRDLLEHIARVWKSERPAIGEQNDWMRTTLAQLEAPWESAGQTPDRAPLDAARRELERTFDPVHGGFGRAPKFPQPGALAFLLRRHEREGDTTALSMAVHSLERMARGGLCDQIGGGFCRYSVDDQWMIPHFEKMLYDNAQLLALYTDAWRITENPLFRDTAQGIVHWLRREMRIGDGGFASSLDADSEGEEGRFYVWDRAQVEALLTSDEYAVFAPVYGLDRTANFEGHWHLHTCVTPEECARHADIAVDALETRLASARTKLLAARASRVRPGRDDKVLTAWNALMIGALARHARHIDPAARDDAERALAFIRAHLMRDGRLLASWSDGHADLPAYLDDHAFLLDATLELLQTRRDDDLLALARQLADTLLDRFEDRERGGFCFTADDHETLIQRPKPLADEALPSGNGVAARALARLGHLTGEPRYLDAAERALRFATTALGQQPEHHAALLHALEEWLAPVTACRGMQCEAPVTALADLGKSGHVD